MEFENTFEVEAPVDEVYAALLDVGRVAPCVPGAQVFDRTGEDAYEVGIKIKVGPMSMLYKGTVEIVDRDAAAHTAAMRARARESRGQGMADAVVRMALTSDGGTTRGKISSDVKLSGKVAAMGGGVIRDVSAKLVDQFAQNLAAMLSGEGVATQPMPAATTQPTPAAAAAAGPATPTEPPPTQATPAAAEATPAEASSAAAEATPAEASSAAAEATPAEASSAAAEATPAEASSAAAEATPAEASSAAAEATPAEASSAAAEATPAEASSAAPEAAPAAATGTQPTPAAAAAAGPATPTAQPPAEADALEIGGLVGPVLLARLRDPKVLGGLGLLIAILVLLRRRS